MEKQDQADILTDEDIERLLSQAETRMRSAQDTINGVTTVGKDASRPAWSSILKLDSCQTSSPYVQQRDEIATVDASRIIDRAQRQQAEAVYSVEKITASTQTKKDKQTAGSDWFDLPKTNLTPELKRDLQMIRMRSVLDPKRHYKKGTDEGAAPKFSQVGTVVEGPTEFISSRIPKKERKRTFVSEAMAAERQSGRFTAKYRDIQAAKTSGKKSYYKNLLAKRRNR
ncbi:dTDP-fucopyranose mutase [Paecilomyces lecythidis]|uniref:dTDP-fucopyranose mutase n=1 Tax=Paecilomyces lecythidis TaxID=3004212 RepID=A0ABR3X871_9EURO